MLIGLRCEVKRPRLQSQIALPSRTHTPETRRSNFIGIFTSCYGSDPNGKAKRSPSDSKEDRWRSFTIEEVKERNYKIDSLKWLKDESLDDGDESIEPEELATDAIAALQAAAKELIKVLALLESETEAEAITKVADRT